MVVSLVGLGLPCLAVFLLLTACRSTSPPSRMELLVRLCLSVGMGWGVSSCGYILWRLTCGTADSRYMMSDCACWGGLALFAFVVSHRRRQPVNSLFATNGFSKSVQRPILISATVMLLIAIAGAGLFLYANPLGEFDACAIWNLRARSLFRMNGTPAQAWSGAFFHPDYPLLLPATIARCWTFLGGESDAVSGSVALIFTFATVGVLVGGIGRFRSLNQGLLAGIVLLGTVRFVRQGSARYADVPLAFFFLATLVFLVEHDSVEHDSSERPSRMTLCLAGMTAALAAWTKNEGVLFLVVVVAVRTLVQWRRSGWKRSALDSALLAAGAVPVFLAVVAFKLQVPVTNDLVQGQTSSQGLGKLIDLSRHGAILLAYARTGLQVGSAFTFILPVCLLLLGVVARGHLARRAATAPLFIIVTMLAGYYAVYLTTPHELHWHLSTSLDRLLVQLWPASILVVFLNLRTPEEVLSLPAVEPAASVWHAAPFANYASKSALPTGPHSPVRKIHT